MPDRAVLVGEYNEGPHEGAPGLGLARAPESGNTEWTVVSTLPLTNPTFGVFDPSRSVLYTSHSGQSYVLAVAVDRAAGTLRKLNTASTASVNPAHLALSPDGRFLVVASFTSGRVSVIGVQASGELDDLVTVVATAGETGPRPTQTGRQPHQVVFSGDGRHILVPDRGRDCILIFRFEAATGALSALPPAQARPGSGPPSPRHACRPCIRCQRARQQRECLPLGWRIRHIDSRAGRADAARRVPRCKFSRRNRPLC
jgi:6-phosphogluconolactonase